MKISQYAELVRLGFDAAGLSEDPAAQSALEDFLDKIDYLAGGKKDQLSDRLEVAPDMKVTVKGTNVTPSFVTEMIVDGYTWSDVMRHCPELEEDDIRACLRFVVESEATADA